jgi:hypothetical protein
MKTTTRKYYVRVPADFSYNGEPHWVRLLEVKTLISAKHYVDRVFSGLPEPEIAVSVNGGEKKVDVRKIKGKWELV